MINHIGMLTLKAEASDEQKQAIIDGLKALVGVIPGLKTVSVGSDLRLKEGNAALIFASVFDSEEAWRDYGTHPAHVALVKTHIAPVLAAKSFVQIESAEGLEW
ncbi:MAG: hypothetical protein RLZZ444_3346 [Pseudomonadota bacterium]|jgi:hypothetical protein